MKDKSLRKRIYEIIEVASEEDKLSNIYDSAMMLTIIVSMIPMCFKESTQFLFGLEFGTVILFVIDYVLRLGTADYKLQEGIKSFIKYPFTFMALVDLLSILPSLTSLNSGFKLFKLLRLGRTLRVLRALKVFKVFKGARYSKSITIVLNVFKQQKEALSAVCLLALGYVLITALVIFNVEPDTFNNLFDAIYWATISLTTVGYGDIFATTTLGRIITMISAVFGIAIVALPAGIITAGYMDELNSEKNEK